MKTQVREYVGHDKPEQVYAFMTFHPDMDSDADPPEYKGEFIRIFKDSVDPEIWKSYCLGLGIDDDESITSFRVYIKDVKIDHEKMEA